MKIRFCSLSSGSSGNCQFIETEDTRILIDGGFSGVQIERLLSSIDICPTTLNGILVTHEHIDHIKGVGVLSRRYNLPIYANRKTWEAMNPIIGNIKDENIKVFNTGKYSDIRDITIYPFHISHDAAEPVGYIVFYKDIKISIMTDIGWVNNKIIDKIKDSQLYYIESNHDVKMLKEGSYPWHLKQRVMSTKGHLSNEDAGRVLEQAIKGENEIILLAHLSQENNLPLLAYDTVRQIIAKEGVDVERDITLDITHRNRVTKVYNL